MSRIKVLIVEPRKEPYEKMIENSLESFQKIVDGIIDITVLEDDIDVILNDEGKLLGLELNRSIGYDIIAGTFIVTGQRNGETISLTNEQIGKYKNIFKINEVSV